MVFVTPKKSFHCLLSAAISMSLIAAGCNPSHKGRGETGTATSKSSKLSNEIMELANPGQKIEDSFANLPLVIEGYTDKTIETFIAYVSGEGTLKSIMTALTKLTGPELIVARLKIQNLIKQMDEAKLYGDDQKARVAELSKALNAHIAQRETENKAGTVAAYSMAAAVGMVAGASMSPGLINSVRKGLTVVSERTPVREIRESFENMRQNRWLKKNPAEFVHPGATPAVSYIRIGEARLAFERKETGFFLDILGAATSTNTSKLQNVGVEFLSGPNAIKKFLNDEAYEWTPTLLRNVRQANTGKRVVYEITHWNSKVTVGFKDLGQEVTRLDRGTQETRELAELLLLRKQKQDRLQALSIEYGDAKGSANVGYSGHSGAQLDRADYIGEQMKLLGNLLSDTGRGSIASQIRAKALLSAEARYSGKVELRTRVRKEVASFKFEEDKIVKAAQQGQNRKAAEREEKANRALQEINSRRNELNNKLAQLDLDIEVMDALTSAIRSRAEIKAKLLMVRAGSDEAAQIQAQLASIEEKINGRVAAVVQSESDQAARASAHLSNQPFKTTLSRSGQYGNQTVSVVVAGHPYPIQSDLNYAQIKSMYPGLEKLWRPQFIDTPTADMMARAAVSGGTIVGVVAIGDYITPASAHDWKDIKPEELEALIQALPDKAS